jgi:hypothetical protein
MDINDLRFCVWKASPQRATIPCASPGRMNMRAKATAKQVIDSLPDDATMDEIIHALYVNVKFARGEKEIREGKGITHEEAKKRLGRWLR